MTVERKTAYKRLVKNRVLCLNEALCFVSSSVLAGVYSPIIDPLVGAKLTP